MLQGRIVKNWHTHLGLIGLILFCLNVLVSCNSFEEEGKVSDIPEMVKLPSGLWISKYEITQTQWVKVMGDNPSHFQGTNLPVESVSYRQAIEFCRKLSELEGRTATTAYRLPTATEWEYACRGGTTTAFYTGIMIVAPSEEKYIDSAASQAAWYKLNASGHTHRIGLKMPNKYGLYDMHGNVSEYIFMDSPPKVISKGGSWYEYADGCQVQSQNVVEYRNSVSQFSQFNGFRVVQSAR